jgi:hypothetical protein
MKHINIGAILFAIIIYILQFLIAPGVYWLMTGHRLGDGFWIFSGDGFIATTDIIITLVGMFSFESKLRYWWVNPFIYYFLIIIYHPKHVYDMGLGGFISMPEGLSIIGYAAGYFILQIAVWIFMKFINWLRQYKEEV